MLNKSIEFYKNLGIIKNIENFKYKIPKMSDEVEIIGVFESEDVVGRFVKKRVSSKINLLDKLLFILFFV